MKLNKFYEQIALALDLPKEEKVSIDFVLADKWDSLGQINIIAMLEKEFGVLLTMDELLKVKSVKDLVDLLASRGIKLN